VAREVGTEGKLAARRRGLASRHVERFDRQRQLHASTSPPTGAHIAEVSTAIASGDLSKKITVDVRGEILLLKETRHDGRAVASFAAEVTRVAREVGTDGRLGGQRSCPASAGLEDLTDNVNLLAAQLTTQVRQHRRRDHRCGSRRLWSRKITVDVKAKSWN